MCQSFTCIKFHSQTTILILLLAILGKETLGECPVDSPSNDLYRLEKTRFYVIQKAKRKELQADYYTGKTLCEKQGLKMAILPTLPTYILASRKLENFAKNHTNWYNSYYWIDATFNEDMAQYIWRNDTSQPLQMTNFYYQHPRPKGMGSFVVKSGYFVKNPANRKAGCLCIGMPRKPHEDGDTSVNGLAVSLWERPCINPYDTSVLCESVDPNCEQSHPNQATFYEEAAEYYQEFWPFSNRRYLVSWMPEDYEGAKALCEKYKMNVLTPTNDDGCLGPILKQWMKQMSVYSFWTDVHYNTDEWLFIYPNGTTRPNAIRDHLRTARAVTTAKTPICTSYFWNDELPGFNYNFCNCTYTRMVLAPENCKSKIGVICQPKDVAKRPCTMEFIKKLDEGPNKAAVAGKASLMPHFQEYYTFDWDPKWKRSAFKQSPKTSLKCPVNFSRLKENQIYWGTSADYLKSEFQYDFTAGYWMPYVNGTEFCHVSKVKWDPKALTLTREITNEDCNKRWAFLLCRLNDGVVVPPPKAPVRPVAGRAFSIKKKVVPQPVIIIETTVRTTTPSPHELDPPGIIIKETTVGPNTHNHPNNAENIIETG